MSKESAHNRNLVLLLTAAVSIIVLIVCVVLLCRYSLMSFSNSRENAKLKNLIGTSDIYLTEDEATGRPVTAAGGNTQKDPDGILKKYSSLYDMNNDLVGWVSIEGTNIDYPVMQTVFDEEYYINHGFDGSEDKEGVPFVDNRCNLSLPSTNLLIYGHNMKNGDIFADLLKYEKESYYREHRFIRFDTVYEEGIYEIIAVFRTRVAYLGEDTFRFYNFIESDSAEEFNDYIEQIRSMSLYNINATAISSDYLLTLTTCEYTVDDGRFVVVARKIS